LAEIGLITAPDLSSTNNGMSRISPVGIDLGTTYSVVARLDEHGKSQIVRNEHGDILTPSVVLFEDEEIVVGKDAKKGATLHADRVAECVKRDMGSEFFSKPIRGEKLPPEVIQACILRRLGADAARACGPEIKVVITVPAYFDEPRRKATADAGNMAGLDVLDIVNEPTAAALAFGEHLGYLDPKGSPKQELKVLVYDLGGGTFDVTLIELKPGHFQTLATDGDVRLGGRDWDQRLADYLAEKFNERHGVDLRENPVGLNRLLRATEEAKHTLSVRPAAKVHLELSGKSLDLEVVRETFEELTEDLLERTAYTCRQVLQAAGTSWQYVSHVLLVGGSTRMPMVSRMLERSTGMKPEHIVNPDEAVARGAALFAGYLLATRPELTPDTAPPAAHAPHFKVTDVNSHSLGIEGINKKTQRKENVILIPRNTPLPCKRDEQFVTKRAGQKTVVVQVLEGESVIPEQCSRIARAVLRELPASLPMNYPIDVTYEYLANGRLSVRAKLTGTNKSLTIDLERERGLTSERLARWKRVMTQNKGMDAFESVLEEVFNMEGMHDDDDAKSAGGGGGSSTDKANMSRDFKQDVKQQRDPSPATKAAATAAAVLERPLPTGTLVSSTSKRTEAVANDSPFAGISGGRSSATSSNRGMTSTIINLTGHVVGAVLGLALGYYILCLIKPDSNVLELNLPGLKQTAPADTPKNTTPTAR
jgi:molecular chaperone DnaK